MASIRSIIGLVAVGLLLAGMVGCPGGSTGQTAHVQGKVTIGGKPIPEKATANIIFRPTGTGQADSVQGTITNGTYDVPDAPTGRVMVEFTILEDTGEMKSFDGVARPAPVIKNLVPAEKQAGVEVQIDGDKSDLNFDL